MAELEKEVVAGIGNKSTGDNIITPAFDATFRQFVVGKDCILDGLELSSDGLKLTAGSCLGKGFQGELKNDITFEAVPQKIYGRFVINHADDTLDHFYIETDPDSGTLQDDILHEKGEYWLLLYENSIMVVDRDYPENAVNSDTTIRLIEDGTIAASAEVEGVIKSGDTNDKTVATTEWVQRVIGEQIGYKTVTINYYAAYSRTNSTRKQIGEIQLERKANYVVATATRTSEENYDIFASGDAQNNGWLEVDTIPAEFRGTAPMFIVLYCKGYTGSSSSYPEIVYLLPISNTTGEVIQSSGHKYSAGQISPLNEGYSQTNITGWKINI